MTTRQEQIIIHLYRQPWKENGYTMPYQTTQDGIAEAIGISRGQVSLELKKLETKGLATHILRHVCTDDHMSRARKCYMLETPGIRTAQELVKGIAYDNRTPLRAIRTNKNEKIEEEKEREEQPFKIVIHYLDGTTTECSLDPTPTVSHDDRRMTTAPLSERSDG